MARKAYAFAGGLLSGVGEGMVSQAEARRKEALERARQIREDRHRQEDREFQTERDTRAHERTLEREEAAHERQRGLLSGTVTGEGRQVYGVTRGGEAVDLGIREHPSAGRSGTGSPPAEVQAAEWLASQTAAAEGRAPTAEDRLEAHRVIRMAKDNPNQRAGLVLRAYEAMKNDPTDRRPDEEKRREAQRFVDDLIRAESEQGGRGGAATQRGQQASEYDSAEAVREAFRAGQLDRDQALEILRNQFGYQ